MSAANLDSAPKPSACLLCEVPCGDCVRIDSKGLEPGEWALLRALGLSERATVRIAKAGDPCILQVRSTRIGVPADLAQRIWARQVRVGSQSAQAGA